MQGQAQSWERMVRVPGGPPGWVVESGDRERLGSLRTIGIGETEAKACAGEVRQLRGPSASVNPARGNRGNRKLTVSCQPGVTSPWLRSLSPVPSPTGKPDLAPLGIPRKDSASSRKQ